MREASGAGEGAAGGATAGPPAGRTRPTAEELVRLAREVIAGDRFPLLATVDGDQPRLRPMTLGWAEDFTTYYVSLRRFHKTVELAVNPKVEVCFLNEHHDQVRLSGIAEEASEPELRRRAWDNDPLLRRYLGTIENPEFLLWRVIPKRVRYMKEWALDYEEVPLPAGR